MGRAIVRQPQAFLMDEPLSNLDAKLRIMMRAELLKLHRQLGTTAIFVTHDQTEAMTLGQRVAVIRNGVIEQLGPPHELYAAPRNTFVAGFIGAPPMNFVDALLNDGSLQVGTARLEVPHRVRRRLIGSVGGPVTLGFRPEAFQDARVAGPGLPTFDAEVEITEQLGHETYAYLRIQSWPVAAINERPGDLDGTIAARLDPRTQAAPGHGLRIAVDLAACHVFDPATGESLLAPSGAPGADDRRQPTQEKDRT
jgi:multiple sugar transport system ATP-binding protein